MWFWKKKPKTEYCLAYVSGYKREYENFYNDSNCIPISHTPSPHIDELDGLLASAVRKGASNFGPSSRYNKGLFVEKGQF